MSGSLSRAAIRLDERVELGDTAVVRHRGLHRSRRVYVPQSSVLCLSTTLPCLRLRSWYSTCSFLFWRVDADGAGYMFDSGQRSYISKQVGEFEQGSLQGTLLSISLLTAAFASFLSNLCFSFFLSDTFVRAVGQTFPGGQFLVSAMCFLLAEWNTNHAFASPTVSAHDRVQQMSHAAQGPAQTSTARRSSGSILEEKLLHG